MRFPDLSRAEVWMSDSSTCDVWKEKKENMTSLLNNENDSKYQAEI